MTIVRKATNGDYYLMRKSQRKIGGGRGHKREWNFYNWFPVRETESLCGRINIAQRIVLPKDLVGKKVRFKVEIMEE